jgi:DUF971 family protein
MTGRTARIVDQGAQLQLTTGDGVPSLRSINAATLWLHCPSALRRRQRLDGRVPDAPAGIRITRVTPMGNYALNIAFSDGHDRGVYPWALLARLAQLPTASDFIIVTEPEPVASAAISQPLA